MDAKYTQTYTVRWADLDANGHMKNTAYIEYAVQSRFAFFAEQGFPATEFSKQHFGPVVFREEVIYYKEMRMLEPLIVTFQVDELNEDGSRFTLHNTLYKENEVKAAEVISKGAWLDTNTRKLTTPPQKLLEVLRVLVIPPLSP